MTGAEGLPTSWMRLPLSQAIAPRGEKASPVDHPEASFIGMDHVEAQSGKIIGSVPAQSMKSAAARFKAGDVLYGRLRPYLNKVTRPKFDGLASAEFIVFPDNGFIANGFLEYRLRSRDFVSFASHLNEGDRPRVDFAQIGDFSFDVPPLPEQHRIVAKIEELFSELDAGTASLTRARAQLKTYRQALLKAAFEGKLTAPWRASNPDKLESPETLLSRIRKERDARFAAALDDWQTALSEWRAGGEVGDRPSKPRRNPDPEPPTSHQIDHMVALPDTWQWIQIADFAFVTKLAGFEYTKHVQYDPNGDLPVLKAENAGPLGFRQTEYSLVRSESVAMLKRSFLEGGELLMVFVGAGTGNVGIVPNDQQYFLGPNIGMIRIEATGLLPRYLELFLRSPLGSELKLSSVKAVAQPSLSMETIRQIPVAIPSPHEQSEIIEVLDSQLEHVDRVEDEIATALTRITALRQSILKKAFSGQLVTQDPADEPASALLARLAQAPAPKSRRKTKP